MTARVTLPDYLQYSSDLVKDVRGGSVSLVNGSRTVFEASASRALAEAAIDGAPQRIEDNKLISLPLEIEASSSLEFTWRDDLGLSAKEPFVLKINAHEDDGPSIWCSQLSREQVVLEDEVLTFQVRAEDDFGVKLIGMEWAGVEDPLRNPHPTTGEKVVAAGDPQRRELNLDTTFSANREGVKPQTLLLRLYTVDYLPGRERVYSPEFVLHVLSPEEHAIWLTNQLRRWFQRSQEVYERELRLHEANKEIRELSPEEIDRPENRRRIETQAAAESANARRLSGLTASGKELIKQAARNDQFNVATLESLAAMVQTLSDIADNRMPSVADLLKQAANAPVDAEVPDPGESEPSQTKPQDSPPQVGVNRDGRTGKGSNPEESEKTPSRIPSIADVESGFNELDDNEQQQSPPPTGSGRLTLPGTVIQGGGPKQPNQSELCPVHQKVAEAVAEQEDLLAEFAKVADELKRILNNLEASTFVKRLKAASRRQLEVSRDLHEDLLNSFGAEPEQLDESARRTSNKLAEREIAQSDSVYVIQEDLEAYYNRVQQGKFKTVLSEMRSTEVVSKLREVADALNDNMNGRSVVHAEFWADTLDRWAEQLVGPG